MVYHCNEICVGSTGYILFVTFFFFFFCWFVIRHVSLLRGGFLGEGGRCPWLPLRYLLPYAGCDGSAMMMIMVMMMMLRKGLVGWFLHVWVTTTTKLVFFFCLRHGWRGRCWLHDYWMMTSGSKKTKTRSVDGEDEFTFVRR